MCGKTNNIICKIIKKTAAAILMFSVFMMVSHMIVYAEIPQKVRTVRVGYCENYGIISASESNDFTGYGYDYLTELSKYTNWSYEFVLVEWEEGLDLLKKGELDLFGPMQYSGEREKYFAYPNKATGIENGIVYALKTNDEFFYEDFEKFDNMRVGTMVNNYHNVPFDNYCRKNNIKVNWYFYKGTTELVQALEDDETDVFIAGSMISDPNIKIVGKYSVDEFFFTTSKENAEFMEQYNEAVEKMEQENTYFTAQLHNKYYNDDIISRAAFTKEEDSFIKSSPPIKIVYDADWSPIEYYNKKSDEFGGINADIMDLVSEYSGLEFEYIRSSSREEAEKYIEAGKADATVGHFSRGNGRQILETNSYLDIPFVVVGKSGASIQDEIKIALSKNNKEMTPEIMKTYGKAQIIIYENLQQCINAIYKNDVDVAIVNSYTFDETVKIGEFERLSILSVSPVAMSMSIGVASSRSPILSDVLNKSISHINYDQKNTIIMNNTINKEYQISPVMVLKNYSGYVIFLLVLASAAVISYITINKRTHMNKLQKIAYYDSLTGMRNLDKFKIDAEIFIKKFSYKNYVVVYADIDKFKYINDVVGYEAGDSVLKMVAETINENLGDNEICARAFADNYVMLLRCKNNKEIRQRLLNLEKQAVDKISEKYDYFQLFFNVGIYSLKPGDDINTAVDNSNLARKTVKGSHRSTLAFYDEKLHNFIIAQTEIESTMKDALANHEFIVYLQPKYNLINEKIAGAEALVRWNSPTKGLIAPINFIPIFERNGFVVNVDLFVFEEVCKKIKQWQDMEIDGIPPISVNFSRIHLSNDKLADNLYFITKKYGVNPKNIEIEITESTIYGNVATLLSIMEQLQSKGFSISMDDFGTGYSSLNLLKDIPINVLKLDKEFLNSASDTERGQKVVSNMVYMAQNLSIKVVAEGVETRQQASFLREINCDMAQGFYFAKPMPISEFEKLVFDMDEADEFIKEKETEQNKETAEINI